MHKWLGITLFPRADIRIVREDELALLFAMVNKMKVSHVQPMIRQWLENIKLTGPIECTSLVTRIAHGVGALSNAEISYIETHRSFIDETYLFQGHIPDGSLVFFFSSYATEIRLPNPDFQLYNCHELTIPLQTVEDLHASCRVTRRMAREAREA